MLRHHLLEHNEFLVLGGNCNCMLMFQLDRTIVSSTDRHHLLVLKCSRWDAILWCPRKWQRTSGEREGHKSLSFAVHNYFYILYGDVSVILCLDRWFWLLFMLIKLETSIYLYLAQPLTTMEPIYGLGRHGLLCAYVNYGGYIFSPGLSTNDRD